MTAADAILERWYAAIRAGDADALAAATTEDVVVDWNGPPGLIPWAGEWRGREAVRRFFALVGAALEVRSVETVTRFGDETNLCLVLRGIWRVRASGEELTLEAANLFTLREGRVARYRVFPNSHAFVAALAGRAA